MDLFFKLMYNLSIRSYVLFLRIAACFHPKAKQWINGRRGLLARLQHQLPATGVDLWIHCASLGEFEQGRPLIEALHRDQPTAYILLTFFSPSGYTTRKTYRQADIVCYLPADTPGQARQFLQLVRPRLTVFVKYEFWFNLLSQLQQQQRPVLLISGIFRSNQLFFKPYGGPFRRLLKGYTRLFVQDQRSASLLQAIGIKQYSIAGDTRFDRVNQLAQATPDYPDIRTFLAGANCWVAGSTWPPDEQLLSTVVDRVDKWIIAPHEIGEKHLQEIEALFPGRTIRYTHLRAHPEAGHDKQLLLLDTIGMLSALYKFGVVAYIGGGFGKGIHNTLEAAVYGIPVLFGPRHEKFEEARQLLAEGAAFEIKNATELQGRVTQLADSSFREAAGRKARHYIENNLGATAAILQYIQENRFLIKP